MRVVRGHRALDAPIAGAVVALGNFDGVHLGHRRLVERARERAGATGSESVVFTFRPHPVKVLAPDLAPPLIVPYEEKVRLLGQAGVGVVVEEEFNRALAAVTPREFVQRILVDAIGAKQVVVGYDFTFGRGRAGNTAVLQELGQELGFDVWIEPAFSVDGIIASSTKVREFILEGRVRGAAIVLGRDFSILGKVVRGEGRGRGLGFPTANIDTPYELIPKPGVYACRAVVDDDRHGAVVNVGYAPTFQSRKLTIEAHLLDYDADLYDVAIGLEFCQRLRDERRFGSVDELVEQIGRDVEEARSML